MNLRYTTATKSLTTVVADCLLAIESGHQAVLRVVDNSEHPFPITIKNPLLEDWRNWQSSYGTLRKGADIHTRCYFNEVEKDMTLNFTCYFGTPELRDLYFNEGKLVPKGGSHAAMGTAFPVRIADIKEQDPNYYNHAKGYFENWYTAWEPAKNLKYHIPAPIGKVYAIELMNEPLSTIVLQLNAAAFLKAETKNSSVA
jgi:hypothetical protein